MTFETSNPTRPGRLKRWIWIVLALIALVTAGLAVAMLEDPVQVDQSAAAPELAPVSVVTVPVVAARAELRTYAQIRPLWAADLSAHVAGTVAEVTDHALAGRRVRAGDLLVRQEDTRLRADLRLAEQALAERQFALLQARNRTELRRREAARNGVDAPGDLTLRLPELRIAEQALLAAEAQVEAAQAALVKSEIRAPFDGVITHRHVSPGQSVAPGDALVRIVDRSRFELEAGLSEAQWALLPRPVADLTAQVVSLTGQPLARATMRDAGGFRDPETREFKLFLEVQRDPSLTSDQQLLTGDLVQLVFEGRKVEATLSVPESAVTRDGFVWHVDGADRLQRLPADLLWQGPGRMVLRAPEDGPFRIALTPLVGFMPGMQVAPIAHDAGQ